MKSFIPFLSVLALAACSKEPAATKTSSEKPAEVAKPAAAPKGQTYGPALSAGTPLTVSAVLDDIDKYAGQKVLVSGTVADVCQMRGCWIDIAGEREGDKLRVKVKDGDIVFPMSAKGKRVVAEGVVVKLEPEAPAAAPAANDPHAPAGGAEEMHGCADGTVEKGHDCSRPPRARARLDGIAARIEDDQS